MAGWENHFAYINVALEFHMQYALAYAGWRSRLKRGRHGR